MFILLLRKAMRHCTYARRNVQTQNTARVPQLLLLLMLQLLLLLLLLLY